MKVTILNSNSRGMVRDLSDTVVSLEHWTWLEGVRVEDGRVKRFKGQEPVGLDVSIDPTAIFEYRHGSLPNALFFVDNESIWFSDGTIPIDVTGSSGPYNSEPNGWTYVNFNGLPIINHYRHQPQAGETFPLATMVDLANWPANWQAHAIRSFKTLLIALNMIIDGEEHPHQFAHSNIVEDPHTPPADWDVADPESVAGLNLLSDTEGPIVDGLQLREVFVIYKDRQAYVLTLGGSNVITINRSFAKGLMAHNCVVEIPTVDGPRHFCVGQEDIYLSSGYGEQSISDSQVSKWFYEQITIGLESQVHVKLHQARGEVWVIFPYGVGATGCNMALIYNYKKPAFYLYPLYSGVLTMESALFALSDTINDAWNADTEVWDGWTVRWVPFPATFSLGRLFAVLDGALIYLDSSDICDVPAIAERTGLAVSGKDYKGALTYDPDIYKLINDFWPRFNGAGVVQVEVPVQELPDGTPEYAGPWTFSIGDKRVPSVYAAGNLFGVRIESVDEDYWEMIGYDIDIEAGGA